VACVDANNEIVSDTFCAPTGKPSTTRPASYAWFTGDWSPCSHTCGGGERIRIVLCRDQNGTVVSDSLCTGPKPASTQECNTEPCTAYEWQAGPFATCSRCPSCRGWTRSSGSSPILSAGW
jgi:hypothetical protein